MLGVAGLAWGLARPLSFLGSRVREKDGVENACQGAGGDRMGTNEGTNEGQQGTSAVLACPRSFDVNGLARGQDRLSQGDDFFDRRATTEASKKPGRLRAPGWSVERNCRLAMYVKSTPVAHQRTLV